MKYRMRTSFWQVFALVVMLQGCASGERITLLPQADGTSSSIIVESRGKALALDKPYQSAQFGTLGIQVDNADPAALNRRYQPVMEALPARPRSYTLYFEFGNTALTRASRQLLDKVLLEMEEMPAPELIVIGHTDEMGSNALNDELSLKRAKAVLALIRGKGINLSRVSAVGRGEREPLVATRPGIPEARNRRVEIRVK